jgi:hypothetical protein
MGRFLFGTPTIWLAAFGSVLSCLLAKRILEVNGLEKGEQM